MASMTHAGPALTAAIIAVALIVINLVGYVRALVLSPA